METIICDTCKQEKAISEIRCKGGGAHPALCVTCFRKKKNAYMKEYYRRPEVNKARKEYEKEYAQIPSVNERKRVYAKGYRETAEAKERRAEWMRAYFAQPSKIEKRKQWAKKSYGKPGAKERKREYSRRPEVKEKKAAYGQRPETKERMKRINCRDIDHARDRYVKNLIRCRTSGLLSAADIPPELIELQRQSLILKREIAQKQQQNEQRNSTNI